MRSEGEYNHAHIPGAVNIPLFSNEERKQVGTTYKQDSREKAIKLGLDFFGLKMRKIVEQVEELNGNKQMELEKKIQNNQLPLINRVFVYCWRGGMRSEAVAWLLNLYGFDIYRLTGGYKAYRQEVLKTFTHPFSLRVLGGFTGSGKTEILHHLKKTGESIIDLEGLAHHKGSAFGNINMPPQPTQEMFENNLAYALWGIPAKQHIWVEDESQRIGNLNIPPSLWERLRMSPLIFFDIPFEERLEHITEEYGTLPQEALVQSIKRISKRLGGLETKKALFFLAEKDMKSCFHILLSYYDKHYLKGLHKRENLDKQMKKFCSSKVTTQNADLFIGSHVSN